MKAHGDSRSGGRILVDQLQAQGVERLTCVPGESFLAVLDALHDASIDVIVCRQEGGAAMMAEAYGKLTGRPGICFVTRGPGSMNGSHGVHIAAQDSTPMIMFVGQVERGMREREAFQELDYKAVFGSERFQQLRAHGARVQRPLWASTGTKNPKYSDVMYVDDLIGPDTVNTVPPQTLLALLDHGAVRPGTLEEDLAGAEKVLLDLETLGISLRVVTQELEDEGVKSFMSAYTEVVEKMDQRRQAAAG